MKATALIERQHREVDSLFESIQASKANAKLLDQLASSLTAHAIIEEQIFYPVAMKAKKDLVLESLEEHELMAHALKRLMACEPKDESFEAKVKTLREIVEEHVQEEEQEMLPSVAGSISADEDEALGKQMETRFDELVHAGYEGALATRKAKRSSNGHRAKAVTTKKKASHAHRKAA